ncbi:hypothetical protein I79_014670 [Cricetulus griseus]|uniref:Uncharacterized protein n=1 Tax=Cricetulus griseus TaxID=10029 RepID=G3HUQ6_CRIGR|nr:hypothetical protein I79_014670 [Cricetulus griseus]
MFALNRVNRLIAAGSETRIPARGKHVISPTRRDLRGAGGTGAVASSSCNPTSSAWFLGVLWKPDT